MNDLFRFDLSRYHRRVLQGLLEDCEHQLALARTSMRCKPERLRKCSDRVDALRHILSK